MMELIVTVIDYIISHTLKLKQLQPPTTTLTTTSNPFPGFCYLVTFRGTSGSGLRVVPEVRGLCCPKKSRKLMK
jgi:hypothetical protein